MSFAQVSDAEYLDSTSVMLAPGLNFSRGKDLTRIASYQVAERLLQPNGNVTANAGTTVNFGIGQEISLLDPGRSNFEFSVALAPNCTFFTALDLIRRVNIYMNEKLVSTEEVRNLIAHKEFRYSTSEELANSLYNIDAGYNQGPNPNGKSIQCSLSLCTLSRFMAELDPSWIPLLRINLRIEIELENANVALVGPSASSGVSNSAFTLNDMRLFATFIRPDQMWCSNFLKQPFVTSKTQVIQHSVEVNSATQQYLKVSMPRMSQVTKFILIPRIQGDIGNPQKDSFNSVPGYLFSMADLPSENNIRAYTSVAQVYRSASQGLGNGAFVNLKTLMCDPANPPPLDPTTQTNPSDFLIAYIAESVTQNHEMSASVHAGFKTTDQRMDVNIFFNAPLGLSTVQWDIYMIGQAVLNMNQDGYCFTLS